MAVEMLSYTRDSLRGSNIEENAVQEAASAGFQEAASAGFQTVEKLILMISNHQRQIQESSSDDNNYTDVADAAVHGFRKFISLLDRNRTGHARFRRGPISPILEKKIMQDERIAENQDPSGFKAFVPAPMHQQKVLPPLPQRIRSVSGRKERAAVATATTTNISFAAPSPPVVPPSSSFVSSFNSGDADSAGFQITNMTQTSSGRPPISSATQKRKSSSIGEDAGKCASSADRCHCSKKRKSKVKSVVKVPAISSKMAEIPSDDCSWRKYGQKPIKGSPHPRGYYRCSSVRGCPAKKHVERSVNEPGILIVTYEGDHNHSHSVPDGGATASAAAAAVAVLESS